MKGKTFKNYKNCSEPVLALKYNGVNKELQQHIPIYNISESGIFQLENNPKGFNLFDKAYSFDDINYVLKDEEDKKEDLEKWIQILKSMQVAYKIMVINTQIPERVNQKERSLESLYTDPINILTNDALNQHIAEKQREGNCEIEQKYYIILSCAKENIVDAKLFFISLENTLAPFFANLGSEMKPLNTVDRLAILHNIYRPGKEAEFKVTSWDTLKRSRNFWKNEISPLVLKETETTIQVDDNLGCVLLARSYPDGLNDGFISKLTSGLAFPLITTMDMSPVPKAVTKEGYLRALMNTEGSIDRQQLQNNKRGAYSTDVSWDRAKEKESLKEDLDEIYDRDERMFFTSLLIYVSAKNQAELDSRVERIIQAGFGEEVVFEIYRHQQLNAFNTVLPTATRHVNIMRGLLTNALSAFCPLHVRDLMQRGGFSYGNNYISKRPIKANKKLLKNGNCFIYAPPGSGKSFFVKGEMTQVINYTTDDVLILDPSNEYIDLVELYGGQFINFSTDTSNYINPMWIPADVFESKKLRHDFISDKCEFMHSLYKHIKKKELEGDEHSKLDECIRDAYDKVFVQYDETGIMEELTFREVHETMLEKSKDEKIKSLADALDLYVNGSLNLFSNKSNVDIHNRIVGFGIRDLGATLKKPAMLIIMEVMRSRLAYNRNNQKATQIYGDELHVVFDEEEFSRAWEKLWKVTRKEGGHATGITQNISDSNMNKHARTMVANSETLILLSLSKTDRQELPSIIDVSDAEMNYLKNMPIGVGLMKYGSTKVIFDNRMSKSNLLYWLYTTDPKDAEEKERVIAKLKRKIQQMQVAKEELLLGTIAEKERIVQEILGTIDYRMEEIKTAMMKDQERIQKEELDTLAKETIVQAEKIAQAKVLEEQEISSVAEDGTDTKNPIIEEVVALIQTEEKEANDIFCVQCGTLIHQEWQFCVACGCKSSVNTQ